MCCIIFEFQLVDTPGLFDAPDDTTATQAQKMLIDVLKCILFTLPGPHVFLLVFRGDTRFAKADVDVIQKAGIFERRIWV
jgi:hypothetical protein